MSKSRFIYARVAGMNPFEQGLRKVIPATLIFAHCEERYLMIEHRNGKWNGLGGKMELDESPEQGAMREFLEESGIEIRQDDLKWVGFIAFPNFSEKKQHDLWVHIYIVELDRKWLSHSHRTEEGVLYWKTADEILNLNLWDGDLKFLPYVFQRKPFRGTFWYKDGRLLRHEIQSIA